MRRLMLALLLGGCASQSPHVHHRRWYPPQQPQTSNWRAGWRVLVALAFAALAAAPSVAHAKPSRSLRIAMERIPGTHFLQKLNQSSDVGSNQGRQGQRNATRDESRAAQGPPNSYGFLPNTGN